MCSCGSKSNIKAQRTRFEKLFSTLIVRQLLKFDVGLRFMPFAPPQRSIEIANKNIAVAKTRCNTRMKKSHAVGGGGAT